MWKWIILFLVLALPLAAQEIDTTKPTAHTIENSIKDLDSRIEKIEINWQGIEEKADDSETWARWITLFGLGLAALFIAFLIIFNVISVKRVKEDLKEINDAKEQIDHDIEEVLSKKEQVDVFLNSLKKTEETIVKEIEEVREEKEKLKKEGKNLEEIDKKYNDLLQRFNTLSEIGIPLSAGGWLETGNEYSDKGNYEGALKAYDKAIGIKPNLHLAYNNKAGTLLKWGATLTGEEAKKKFELAKESAKKAIEYSKGKKGHYNLACAQAKLGELDEALNNLKEDKEIKGDDFDTAYAWQDPDFEPLRKGKWRKRFIEIVGPLPKGAEGS